MVTIPKKIGHANSYLDKLYDTLVEIADAVNEMEPPEPQEQVAGTVQLCGQNPTKVVFGESLAAMLELGAGPYNLSTSPTLKLTVDGTEETIILGNSAGYIESADTAVEDISAEVDNALMIAVDEDYADNNYHLVELDLTQCTAGLLTAAEMETKIQALGEPYTAVTVAYASSKYVITSGTTGRSSTVSVLPAQTGSITEELGFADSTNEFGLYVGETITAVTQEELVEALNYYARGFGAYINGDVVTIVSEEVGLSGSIVVGNGTSNAILGITQVTSYGAQGIVSTNRPSTGAYVVCLTPVVTQASELTDTAIASANKTASGFDIISETAAADTLVDVFIVL